MIVLYITHTHTCENILDTSVALDSLLLDVGQWSRRCVWQGVDDVRWWSWWGVWRCESFTGILRFHFYCPHFLLPSFVFHLLLRQTQIKECWKKKKEKKHIDRVSWNQGQQDFGLRFIIIVLFMYLLTHSPLPTNIRSWKYVSKVDIRDHQVWMVLSKSIISDILYKLRLNHVCVFFLLTPLTGCRFLFSRWFCSMAFKSRSPSSVFSVKA